MKGRRSSFGFEKRIAIREYPKSSAMTADGI
jgi:hypothetical protein